MYFMYLCQAVCMCVYVHTANIKHGQLLEKLN